ncbi:MAG TPA: preprotein translocase subunit SecE [Dehalococcoidia bacterium]|nr:preprotein translocase subunit SecE [Dehalococcoidia bacterium]
MNREARRHPPQAKPGRGGRASSARPSLSTGGVSSGRGGARLGGAGRSLFRANWLQDIWSEMKKVQWPTRTEAWHLTLVVILVSVVVGVALGGIDSGFGWFMEHTVLK